MHVRTWLPQGLAVYRSGMHLKTWLPRWVWRPFEGAGRATAFHAAGVAIQGGVLITLLLLLKPLGILLAVKSWLPGPLQSVPMYLLLSVPVVVLAGPLLSRAQRVRFRDVLGVDVPTPAALAERPGPRGMVRWLRAPEGRRQLGYHFLAAPLCALGGAAVLTLWVMASAYVWNSPHKWRLDQLGYAPQTAYLTGTALATLYGTAWLAKALALLDTRAAHALLGPSRQELARRVADLADRRAGVIDAADAERRRIERDLHDGAQQRLVALAVNLGLAKATLSDRPEDARKVIDEAHREAKEAIAELNNLVRGLHPAILEDRGLDAALSGIAARLPITVRVTVDLPRRPSATVEAVAYFVVSETLTNVVKHAHATRADVTVERIGETLLVVVTDDGVGGAELDATTYGTGLAGLARRVTSVDGTFSVRSPAGGPTVVTVELPCAP